MTSPEFLDRFAPCGLDCSRCFARAGGAVLQPVAELLQALAGFEHHAPRMAQRAPVPAAHAQFHEVVTS